MSTLVYLPYQLGVHPSQAEKSLAFGVKAFDEYKWLCSADLRLVVDLWPAKFTFLGISCIKV